MLADNIVIAIMATSVTGAGLVIAFYALLARMSEKIFSTRFEQLDESRADLKRISSNPDSFDEKNLKKTTAKLQDLQNKIRAMKAFPQYLGWGVIISFILFIVTSVFSLTYLTNILRSEGSGYTVVAFFMISLALFAGVGIYGIVDVNDAILINFKKLSTRKEEIKQEISNAPEEFRSVSQIESLISSLGLTFERNVSVKSQSDNITPDLVIPSASNPKWLIEIWNKPTFNLLNRLSIRYMNFASESINVKTLFISNFEDKELKRFAESYFDFVVDFKNIDTLKKILMMQ